MKKILLIFKTQFLVLHSIDNQTFQSFLCIYTGLRDTSPYPELLVYTHTHTPSPPSPYFQ